MLDFELVHQSNFPHLLTNFLLEQRDTFANQITEVGSASIMTDFIYPYVLFFLFF